MFDNAPPLVVSPDAVLYVTLDMRVRRLLVLQVSTFTRLARSELLLLLLSLVEQLLNWSYLNFKIRTKTSTRLFAIKVVWLSSLDCSGEDRVMSFSLANISTFVCASSPWWSSSNRSRSATVQS